MPLISLRLPGSNRLKLQKKVKILKWLSHLYYIRTKWSRFLNRTLKVIIKSNPKIAAPCYNGYDYYTTSFNKTWTLILRRFKSCWQHIGSDSDRFKSCWQHIGDLQWWASLTMVPARNKAKPLSSVNHSTKTIHHNHRKCFNKF